MLAHDRFSTGIAQSGSGNRYRGEEGLPEGVTLTLMPAGQSSYPGESGGRVPHKSRGHTAQVGAWDCEKAKAPCQIELFPVIKRMKMAIYTYPTQCDPDPGQLFRVTLSQHYV